MKTRILSLILLLGLITNNANSQYVNIPDPNFAAYLQTTYPFCMQGSLMDTTCGNITQPFFLVIDSLGISDLTGIQYFDNLEFLDCSFNNLTALPTLPPLLQQIQCDYNNFTHLVVPAQLGSISASYNLITSVAPLPAGLGFLVLVGNQLDSLPPLPQTLRTLNIAGNRFSEVPPLPPTLRELRVGNNPRIDSLPPLPATLRILSANNDSLRSLPALPDTLQELSVGANFLDSIPALPASLTSIGISNNNISVLPDLPPNLTSLNIFNNPISCLPPLKRIGTFNYFGTNITCLPNLGQITNANPPLSTYPLCGQFNTPGCAAYYTITGRAYIDDNANCLFDGNDYKVPHAKVQLFENGQLIQQAITGADGVYSFDVQSVFGTYVVGIDSSAMPFTVNCPDTAYYTNTVSATVPVFFDQDFGLGCGTYQDLGVQNAVLTTTWFRPTSLNNVRIQAGDMTNLGNASCAAGVAGQVTVVMTGPAGLTGYGGLTPTTVTGDTVIWDVTDFGTIDFDSSFSINFTVDTFAQAQDLVCFEVFVTTPPGDVDTSNNHFTRCFQVVNAYDPNNKEVYPLSYIDTNQVWLYYNINFQNTGTAPAMHVQILDTLSTHLDHSSIQLLGSSHDNYIQISQDGEVAFNFPNIELPDSTTDEPGSKGYISYKIKLQENLPIGTVIENTAHIYFDFNPPIVTNTTVNTIYQPVNKPLVSATAVTACVGDSITLSTTLNPNYTYTWLNNGNAIPNTNVATFTVGQTGNYGVQVTDGISEATSDLQQVNFNSLPTAILTLPQDSFCVGNDPVDLSSAGSPAGGVLSGMGIGADALDVSAAGTYTITYTYTDGNGCADEAQKQAIVATCTEVGIEDNTSLSANIYPNPTTGQLVIDLGHQLLSKVLVFDLRGKAVQEHVFESNITQTELNLSELSNGLYIIRAQSGDAWYMQRVAVQR